MVLLRRLVLHAVAVTVLFAMASTAADPSKMRLKELMKLLQDRGVKCIGCTEKEHFVQRAQETEHLDHVSQEERKKRQQQQQQQQRGGGRQRSTRDMRGDPNDWVNAKADSHRIDLWRPIKRAFGEVFWFLWAIKGILTVLAVPSTYFYLRHSHKTGKHNDVPFQQYLRFLARRTWKSIVGITEGFKRTVLDTLVAALSLGGGDFIAWLRKRTRSQLAHAALVFGVWCGFLSAGFAFPGLVLVGFYIVWANLGKRKEGQGSAYSVFNNFQHLEGELRMEQIEAEMRHMPINMGGGGGQEGVTEGKDEERILPAKALGRNDKVEVILKSGEKKDIKFKSLQQYIDQGCMQVKRVRYEGIRYRGRSFVDDSDEDD